jgi:biotin operon repressor
MVPRRLLRRPDAGQMCAHCAALFAVLDECQGERGRPWRGRNKLVKALGWSRETVTEHVRHLEAAGLLEVEQVGQRQAVYRVANPSRLAPPVDGTPPTPDDGPVDGTPPTEVDGTPPSSGRDAAHLAPDCGRDAAHRPRSPRYGPGLTPDDTRAVGVLTEAFGELETVDDRAGRCACGAVADAGEWCDQCAPF